MDTKTQTKLNRLLKAWPPGTVATHDWLRTKGISRDLAKSYVRVSWLTRLGSGAYGRADSSVTWVGGLYAMQRQLRLPVHVGAVTALALQGHAHFLPLKGGTVHLFAPARITLPMWFKRRSWGVKFRFHSTSLFPNKRLALVEKSVDNIPIHLASLERAMLEHLHLARSGDSYQEARALMEGLISPNPKIVQTLLRECRSVKAKRLFLALADECGHPWMKDVDLSKVDLGKGKRVFARGGRLHPKFKITLPAPTNHG